MVIRKALEAASAVAGLNTRLLPLELALSKLMRGAVRLPFFETSHALVVALSVATARLRIFRTVGLDSIHTHHIVGTIGVAVARRRCAITHVGALVIFADCPPIARYLTAEFLG
jgi:hypothetical protein